VQIGVLARKLFPGGVLVDADANHLADAVRITRELINNSQVPAIFEATFTCDGVLVRVDVLRRKNVHQFRVIEVKSTTSVKPYHLWDVSIQTYVLRGAGIQISSNHLLREASLSQIAAAIGLSIAYASEIRTGRRRPHPRHWQALAELAGAAPFPVTCKVGIQNQCLSTGAFGGLTD